MNARQIALFSATKELFESLFAEARKKGIDTGKVFTTPYEQSDFVRLRNKKAA